MSDNSFSIDLDYINENIKNLFSKVLDDFLLFDKEVLNPDTSIDINFLTQLAKVRNFYVQLINNITSWTEENNPELHKELMEEVLN